MDHVFKAYFSIILEDVLSNEHIIERISHLPFPLNSYLGNIRKAMLSATTAETDKEMVDVNIEVNKWRDALVKYWVGNQQKFSQADSEEVESILLTMISRYTALMNGYNTGYASIG